jgi:predicted thioredoxin/glutaredoxin
VTTLTLLTRPGCHLCDEARGVVAGVLDSFPDVGFVETSIVNDPALVERYVEEIPVVLIDGAVHNIWRVDADRLTAALHSAASKEKTA